jgi:hypothetical protein
LLISSTAMSAACTANSPRVPRKPVRRREVPDADHVRLPVRDERETGKRGGSGAGERPL